MRTLGKLSLAGFALPGALFELKSETLPFLINFQACLHKSAWTGLAAASDSPFSRTG